MHAFDQLEQSKQGAWRWPAIEDGYGVDVTCLAADPERRCRIKRRLCNEAASMVDQHGARAREHLSLLTIA